MIRGLFVSVWAFSVFAVAFHVYDIFTTPPPPQPTPLCHISYKNYDKQTAKALLFWLGPMDVVPCKWLKQKLKA